MSEDRNHLDPIALRDALVRAVEATGESAILPAIRAELFFHLLHRDAAPWKFRARNIAYPAWFVARALRARMAGRGWGHGSGAFAFVIQYAATPGFGTLSPVIRAIHARGGRTIAIVTDEVMRARERELHDLGCQLVVNADAAAVDHIGVVRDARRTARELASALNARCTQPDLATAVARSRRVLETLLVKAQLYRAVMLRVFAEQPIRCVVNHNDFACLPWTSIRAARDSSIAEFTLQHGSPSFEYFPTFSERYLLWGDLAHRQFLENGAPRSTLHVVGAPRIDDAWKARTAIDAEDASRRIRAASPVLKDKRRIIAVMSHTHSPAPTSSYHEVTLRELAELARRLPDDVGLAVKLHPQETDALYRRVVGAAGVARIAFLRDEVPLQVMLRGATAVASAFSTTLVEAMLVDAPVIQYNFPRAPVPDFSRESGGTYVETVDELLAALERFEDPASRAYALARQQEFCRAYFANLGRATERVVDELSA